MKQDFVEIIEVGPRDGLQSQKISLDFEKKVTWIQNLIQTGFKRIEVGAFVSAQKVPMMADTAKILRVLPRGQSRFVVLVPNPKGMELALESQVDEVAIFTACSESFTQNNIGMSIDESFEGFEKIYALAKNKKIPVRGYLSTVFSCPYEGKTDLSQVLRLTDRLLALGCHEICLSDTTGVATPDDLRRIVGKILEKHSAEKLVLHLHDTYGRAVLNTFTAFELGIRKFDASAGGLGGCPFAPGASGNVASEDLLSLFNALSVETGLDAAVLQQASEYLQTCREEVLPSKVFRAQRKNLF
jgi:hydroxymethylglutaryl-CoA lyase